MLPKSAIHPAANGRSLATHPRAIDPARSLTAQKKRSTLLESLSLRDSAFQLGLTIMLPTSLSDKVTVNFASCRFEEDDSRTDLVFAVISVPKNG